MEVFDYFKQNDKNKVTEWLKSPENDVGLCDNNGLSLVHWACQKSFIDVLETLKLHGMVFHSLSDSQDTPLHIAALHDQIDAIRELLKARVPLSVVNSVGNTALHYSCFKNNKKLSEILIRSGIDHTVKNHMGKTALDLASIELASKLETIINDIDGEFDNYSPLSLQYGNCLPNSKSLQSLKIDRFSHLNEFVKKELLYSKDGEIVWKGLYNSSPILIKSYDFSKFTDNSELIEFEKSMSKMK